MGLTADRLAELDSFLIELNRASAAVKRKFFPITALRGSSGDAA